MKHLTRKVDGRRYAILTNPLPTEIQNVLPVFQSAYQELWENWIDLQKNGLKVDVAVKDVHGLTPQLIGDHEMGVGKFRLKALYVDFRQFWMQKSPIEFNKVCNLLYKHTESDVGRDTIKILKCYWKKEPILFDKHSVSSKDLIDAVFNGELFHRDEGKIDNVSGGHTMIADEFLASALFFAVYDRIAVLQRLNTLLFLAYQGKPAIVLSDAIRFSEPYDGQPW
ncbi:hypothetical protein [Ruegeria atlantica]|uniref:hypothetical protein n=1 Tax=Ruegeria atlantica TaxID=81569 RepID=UPI00147A0E04|nr:hypothetical protein [Ruegeria atlantica]